MSAFLDCREGRSAGFVLTTGRHLKMAAEFSLLRETFLRSLQSELHEDS